MWLYQLKKIGEQATEIWVALPMRKGDNFKKMVRVCLIEKVTFEECVKEGQGRSKTSSGRRFSAKDPIGSIQGIFEPQ